MAIKTLEDVFEYLDGRFGYTPPEELEYFKSCDVCHFHHTLGRDLRNYFKLWSPNTALTRFFRDTCHDIVHADDISSLILGAYQAKLLNKEFSIYFEAIKYRNHWRSLGLFEKMLQEFDEKKLVDDVP